MEVYIYEQVKKFIKNIDDVSYAKVLDYIGLLRKYGSSLRPPESKKVHTNLFELRIKAKVNVRIFYTFHEGSALLVYAYNKKTQKIDLKTLKHLKALLKSID